MPSSPDTESWRGPPIWTPFGGYLNNPPEIMTGSFRNCMGFSLPFKTGPKPGSRIALIAFLCETTNGAQVRAKKLVLKTCLEVD